ncbi:hypothetical protein BH23GEM5_BH23GEM5_06790 [soil metagenome]
MARALRTGQYCLHSVYPGLQTIPQMHYKDQARPLSLLSGLALGVALGAVFAVLLGMRWRSQARRSVRGIITQ